MLLQIIFSEIVEDLEGDGVREFQKLLYLYRNPTYAPDLIVFLSFLLPLLLLTLTLLLFVQQLHEQPLLLLSVCLLLHLPKVNRKTRSKNSQQILENIGYGLGVTP